MFGDGFTASGIKAYRSNWNDLLITFDGFEDTLTIKDYCINENARNFTLVFADGTVVEAAARIVRSERSMELTAVSIWNPSMTMES